MLDVMREMGLSYDPYAYDDEYDSCANKLNIEQLINSIDKVDVAGCISNKKVRSAAEHLPLVFRTAPELLTTGMRPIITDSWPRSSDGSLEALPPRPSSELLLPLLTLLATWGLLWNCTEAHIAILAVCSFFVVPKAAGKLRIIFDGRPANKHLRTPLPVCLCSIAEVLARIARETPKVVYLADFRHFFHQMSLPEDFTTVLGTSCGKSWFSCRTLPMGLSWAPFLAQSYSWIFMLFTPAKASALFSTTATERLPTFIDVLHPDSGEIIGFATVVYDNFIITLNTEEPKIVNAFDSRLLGNATHFGFQFKEIHRYHVAGRVFDLQCSKRDRAGKRIPLKIPRPCVFLGVDIDLNAPVSWRHAEKRREKAKQILGRPKTCRDIARKVGLIIWDCVVKQRRLATVKCIIDILKGLNIKSKRDWDRPAPFVDDSWLSSADEILLQIFQNDPFFPSVPDPFCPPRRTIYAASDASSHYGGGVIFDEVGNIDDLFRYDELESTHIFIKEAHALKRLVYRILNNLNRDAPVAPIRIVVAVDNIPVRRAFEKAYSTNTRVCKIIERVYSRLDPSCHSLELVDIGTDFNVADCMTRDDHNHDIFEVCNPRKTATWDILHGRRASRGISTCTSKISSLRLMDAGASEVGDVVPAFASSDDSDGEDGDDDDWLTHYKPSLGGMS